MNVGCQRLLHIIVFVERDVFRSRFSAMIDQPIEISDNSKISGCQYETNSIALPKKKNKKHAQARRELVEKETQQDDIHG